MSIKIFLLPVVIISFFLTGFSIPVSNVPEPRNLQVEVFTAGNISCDGATVSVYEIGNYSNNAYLQRIPGTCIFQGTVDIPTNEVTFFMVDVCLGGPQNSEKGHTTIEVSKVADKIPTYAINTSFGQCVQE